MSFSSRRKIMAASSVLCLCAVTAIFFVWQRDIWFPVRVPINKLDLRADLQVISKWACIGPYFADEKRTEERPFPGLDASFLAPLVDEGLIDQAAFERVIVSTTRHSGDVVGGKAAAHVVNARSIDLVPLFGRVKQTTAYLATIVDSPVARRVAFLAGANAGLVVWVNGQRASRFDAEARALREYQDVAVVDLRKGRNFVLAKVTNVERDMSFSASIATLSRAREIGWERMALWSTFEDFFVSAGGWLTLSPLFQDASEVEVTLLANGGVEVLRRRLSASDRWLKVDSVAPGVYRASVRVAGRTFVESVLLGPPEELPEVYEKVFKGRRLSDEDQLTFDGLIGRLRHLLKPESRSPRRPEKWKRRLLLVAQQIEDAIGPSEHGTLFCGPGLHHNTFRSAIDGTAQSYMIFVPEGTGDAARLPLAVITPPDTDPMRPFLQSYSVAAVDQIGLLASLSRKHGIAVLWTNMRGNGNGRAIAVEDAFEAIADAKRRFRIDDERLYVMGGCAGGGEALTFAARVPGLFAAVAAENPATVRELYAKGGRNAVEQAGHTGDAPRIDPGGPHVSDWLVRSTSTYLAGNLLPTPVFLGLERGDLTNEQALAFFEKAEDADLSLYVSKTESLVSMDERYEKMFAFLTGRRLRPRPAHVRLTIGEPRYDRAHWIRASRFSTEGRVPAGVEALFTGPDRVDILNSQSVGEIEVDSAALGVDQKALTVWRHGRRVPTRPSARGGIVALLEERPSLPDPGGRPFTVEEALATPFLVVSDAIDPGDNASRAAMAFSTSWQHFYFGAPRMKAAQDVLPEDVAKFTLVLLGDVRNRSGALDGVLSRLRRRVEVRGDEISVDEQKVTGSNLGYVVVEANPMSPERAVIRIGATDETKLRVNGPRLSLEGGYSWAIFKLPPNGEVVASEMRDERIAMTSGVAQPSAIAARSR